MFRWTFHLSCFLLRRVNFNSVETADHDAAQNMSCFACHNPKVLIKDNEMSGNKIQTNCTNDTVSLESHKHTYLTLLCAENVERVWSFRYSVKHSIGSHNSSCAVRISNNNAYYEECLTKSIPSIIIKAGVYESWNQDQEVCRL